MNMRMVWNMGIGLLAAMIAVAGWSFMMWRLPPSLPAWPPAARFVVLFVFSYSAFVAGLLRRLK